jgi:acyl-coenzyme A synthetase/AMP-(fatty) acid ligase
MPNTPRATSNPLMPRLFPLLRCASDELTTHVVAYRHGAAITADVFLRDVYAVTAHLPEADYVLNVCSDRYHIAVLLGAVMLRGTTSLLPPNTARETLRDLRMRYPRVCLITDQSNLGYFEDAIAIESLLANPFSGPAPIPRFAEDCPVGILFTSGSTGEPVANVRTWGALCGGVLAENDALDLAALGHAVLIGTVPAQHSYGLESTVALALANGHALSADHSFYPADIAAALARVSRPRVLVTTPFHLRVFVDSDERFPPVDLIISATAPLAPQLAQRAEARFAAPVREIYGCTEAGQVAWRRTTAGEAWTLFPGVKLSQHEGRTWVAEGHVGSAKELHDLIEPVSDTTFRLSGRLGDMLNIAGKRTSLAHLNFQLNSIPGVEDGVFMAPSRDEANTVPRMSAMVVAPRLTAEAITAALRERIDPVFLPRPLLLVDSLPRNATGKITQGALRELMQVRRG